MKKVKIYSSYAEVHRDLAIYELEMELYKEKMKFDLELIKEDLTFKNVVAGYFGEKESNDHSGGWLSKLVISFLPWTSRLFWKIIR